MRLRRPGFVEPEIGIVENLDEDGAETRRRFQNPDPLIGASLGPGFNSAQSEVRRRPGSISPNFEVRESGYFQVHPQSLYLLELHAFPDGLEALDCAYRTLSESLRRDCEPPKPFAFSGQAIGDFCWSAKTEHDWWLFVVTGSYFFRLQVHQSVGPEVEKELAEIAAQGIVSRLRDWPRPRLSSRVVPEPWEESEFDQDWNVVRRRRDASFARPVGSWTWSTPCLLRQECSEWFGAVRAGDGKTAVVRVMRVSGRGRDLSNCEEDLERRLRRLTLLPQSCLSQPVDYGIEQEANRPLGRAWYALDCELPLRTLAEYAAGGIDRAEACRLIESLAHGLSEAHQFGICLRPEAETVLIAESGRVSLLLNLDEAEFSRHALARSWAPPPPGPRLWPPEEGDYDDFGPAGDQYRLGALAYFLLCGQLLAPEDFSPDLGSAVAQVLRRSLAEQPEQRFPSVTRMVTALREALT